MPTVANRPQKPRCSSASMPDSSIARSRRRTSFGALMSETVVVVWSCRKVHSLLMEQTISDIAIDRRAAAPLFRQVYAAISSSIVDGRLRAGARLPASRELAERLGLSRTVVVAAYEQLLATSPAASAPGP